MVYILAKKELVFVGITYYMPDYSHLIQTFHWQTEDIVPHIPRVHKFLDYWKRNIEAVIKEVQVSSSPNHKYTNAQYFRKVIN
jgi:uncharacterized protein Usg